MYQKILIYLDILGFDELPKIIGNEKGIESKLVRENLIQKIQEKIQMLYSNGYIQGLKYGESDDWLLAINIGYELDEYETIIRVISTIMDHDSGFLNYEKIPLSIIVGTAKYEEEVVLDGKKLICEDGTIDYLKLNLTSKYRNWYSAQNPSASRVTSTYVLATESIYEFMEPLDKESCTTIVQDSTKFFEVDSSYILRRNKLFDFLDSINLLGSKIYNRIDDIFVPPQCYEKIKEKLEKERIVIITGPPELGKTYTAVRLLWEYYLNDFKPKWYLGEELIERKDSRQKLIEIQRELKQDNIIVFEDPFGKIEYENRDNLERMIGFLFNFINKQKKGYVIITSRIEVFKKLLQEQLSTYNFYDIEESLEFKPSSYDFDSRITSLLLWAKSRNCVWLNNDELFSFIREKMRDLTILPTQLCVREFAFSTVNTQDKEKLLQILKKKSQVTVRRFVTEIHSLETSQIIFLLIALIFAYETETYRLIYNKVAELMHVTNADFDSNLTWFRADKLTILNNRIMLSHPSYLESLNELIIDPNPVYKSYKSMLSKILITVFENNISPFFATESLKKYFGYLPLEERNELLLLSFQSEIVSKKEYRTFSVVSVELFLKFFSSVTKEIEKLFIFALQTRKKDLSFIIASFENIALNYNDLPKHIQDYIVILIEDPVTLPWIINTMFRNYEKIETIVNPYVNQLKLNKQILSEMVWGIINNYENLPQNIQSIVEENIEDSEIVRYIARAILSNYNDLPDDLRLKLFDLAENENAIYAIIEGIIDHLPILPNEVVDILTKYETKFRKKISILVESIDPEYRKKAIEIIDKTLPLIRHDYSFYATLQVLLNDKDVIVSTMAKGLLRHIFYELSDKSKQEWNNVIKKVKKESGLDDDEDLFSLERSVVLEFD